MIFKSDERLIIWSTWQNSCTMDTMLQKSITIKSFALTNRMCNVECAPSICSKSNRTKKIHFKSNTQSFTAIWLMIIVLFVASESLSCPIPKNSYNYFRFRINEYFPILKTGINAHELIFFRHATFRNFIYVWKLLYKKSYTTGVKAVLFKKSSLTKKVNLAKILQHMENIWNVHANLLPAISGIMIR